MGAEDWEAEKAFWERHKTTKCYDLEHDGGYLGSSSMVEQNPDEIPGEPGTYVKAEDYRRVVEALEQQLTRINDNQLEGERAAAERGYRMGYRDRSQERDFDIGRAMLSKKGESDE